MVPFEVRSTKFVDQAGDCAWVMESKHLDGTLAWGAGKDTIFVDHLLGKVTMTLGTPKKQNKRINY